MTVIKGTKVFSQLTPGDDSVSKYGTHYSYLGTGGYHEVLTEADRDSIPVDIYLNDDDQSSGRRRLGMQVYVIEDDKVYTLGAGLAPATWSGFTDQQKIDYLADDVNWVESGGIEGQALSKVLFVNPNGFAGTPEKGNIFKPYQDPDTALAAAVDGDFIMVLNGTFSNVGTLSLSGGKITWQLKGNAVINMALSAPIIDHQSIESQTYIYGDPGTELNHSGLTGTLITNLHADSVVHIDVDIFTGARTLNYSCKEFIFKCRTFNWNGPSVNPFTGTLPVDGFFRFTGKIKNINTGASAAAFSLNSTDSTGRFLLKDCKVEDLTSGTSSTFFAVKFGTGDPLLLLDNFSCEIKSDASFSIDSVNQTNARVRLLTPSVVNKEWGTSGSGTFQFEGSIITDLDSGTVLDASVQSASRLISTDADGKKVQQYQVDIDQTLATESDNRIPTQKAVKLYVDSQLPAGNDGVKLRGSFKITSNPAEYPKPLAGDAVNADQVGDASNVIPLQKAEGKINIAIIVAGDEFIINGQTFTADTDFALGVDTETTVDNLVTVINTTGPANTIVEAIDTYNDDNTVTIRALTGGSAGNSIGLNVGPGGTFNTVDDTNLTGGTDAETKINRGDAWFVKDTGSATIGPATSLSVNDGDLIIAIVDEATNVHASWLILEALSQDATETQKGIAELATDAETQTGTDNTRIITPLKLANWWTNIKTLAQTFAAKITFTSAPRFSSTTASQILAVDGSKDLTSKVFDDDDTLAADSADRVPTQAAVKGYVDSFASLVINVGNGLFVTENGDDGTGTVGDLAKPFATLNAAQAAASSGDTIYVFPGTYTITASLAKDGLTYYLEEGVIIQNSTGGISMVGPTADNQSYKILGRGYFDQNSSSGRFCLIENSNCDVYLQLRRWDDARTAGSGNGSVRIDAAVTSGNLTIHDVEETNIPSTFGMILTNGGGYGTITIENCNIQSNNKVLDIRNGRWILKNSKFKTSFNLYPVELGTFGSDAYEVEFHNCIIEDARTASIVGNSVISVGGVGHLKLIGTNILYTSGSTTESIRVVSSHVRPVQILGTTYANKPPTGNDFSDIYFGNLIIDPDIEYSV